ncbi:hypothetical protein OSL35_11215 [Escherichia coli]|nr:aminoglycoside phosphotransferase family protein [Escherichia coli]MCW3829100.1 hypothetical protein [Escherichia coli]MDA6682170.1 hypothetical protein [Escherichia coli]
MRKNHFLTTAGLDRKRLLMWIIAWCGLSAAW